MCHFWYLRSQSLLLYKHCVGKLLQPVWANEFSLGMHTEHDRTVSTFRKVKRTGRAKISTERNATNPGMECDMSSTVTDGMEENAPITASDRKRKSRERHTTACHWCQKLRTFRADEADLPPRLGLEQRFIHQPFKRLADYTMSLHGDSKRKII